MSWIGTAASIGGIALAAPTGGASLLAGGYIAAADAARDAKKKMDATSAQEGKLEKYQKQLAKTDPKAAKKIKTDLGSGFGVGDALSIAIPAATAGIGGVAGQAAKAGAGAVGSTAAATVPTATHTLASGATGVTQLASAGGGAGAAAAGKVAGTGAAKAVARPALTNTLRAARTAKPLVDRMEAQRAAQRRVGVGQSLVDASREAQSNAAPPMQRPMLTSTQPTQRPQGLFGTQSSPRPQGLYPSQPWMNMEPTYAAR